jgi:hypothetical protein
MPYTHGLLGAVILSGLFDGAVALFMRANEVAVFWIVTFCAFSTGFWISLCTDRIF